jgi:hypothetical protein
MPNTITVRGRALPIGELPPVDVCEDIIMTLHATNKRPGVTQIRIGAAMVLLCVPEVRFAARLGGIESARESLLNFGGEALVKLREMGWATTDITQAAEALIPVIIDRMSPTKTEVEAAAGKSSAAQG